MSGSKKKTRVAAGMSGGVDSSLAAALLVEQGYDVTGVHLECWSEPGCRAPQDRKDALQVALQLGIPFEVLDFKKEYSKKVIDYFYREYEAGRTPNPDVVCNREIKFGLFLSWVLENGFDYVATGHYARISERVQSPKLKVKSFTLLRGVDPVKDQTYFLYMMTQDQLKHVLFPVGHLTKKQVRSQAKKRGLVTANKPDSVGICFVGEVDVNEFLRRRIPEKKGEVVDTKENVIGEHRGVWFYTIGQRHGFTINHQPSTINHQKKHAIPPLYVVSKNVVQNRLVVGVSQEAQKSRFSVEDVHWVGGIKNQELGIRDGLKVRIRHCGALIPTKLIIRNSKFIIRLKEPQRGIAPGQSAVFYKGEECLGGGVIQ